MKKDSIIEFAAFLIPAILAFLSFNYGGTLARIGYAIAIGLVVLIPVAEIIKGAKKEFRQTAPISEKVGTLIHILVFPLSYLFIYDFYAHNYDSNEMGRCGRAWISLIVALAISMIVLAIVKYIIKMFEK